MASCPVPARSFLARYSHSGHTDCYDCRTPRTVALPDLIAAFYTAPSFRPERLVLRLAGMGFTDAQVNELARAETHRFAAWTVEDRSDRAILLRDLGGSTRSYLAVEPEEDRTRLLFGSAVVGMGQSHRMPLGYRVLLPVHLIYSRVLLAGARRRLA